MSLGVQHLPEENYLHHSPPTEHVTRFGNSNASEAIFITILLNTPFSPLSLFELLQFQIKMLKFRVVNGFRS